MGLIQDLFKEIPLSSVLRERVALAEEKYERANQESAELRKKVGDLEGENDRLRALVAPQSDGALGEDTSRVLVALFKATRKEDRDVGLLAQRLQMERGVLQYHLDRLHENGLAQSTGGNYLHGHVYWGLMPDGRKYAVENKLV